MIESILDLSRLDMWKSKKLELVPVDIRDIADQVISAYRPLAENAGLELLSEVSPDLPDVQGEPNQLARLITNLLSNAIRYTPGGQVCVRLSQDGSYICVQVEDTGIGVEPEDLPHLFDRFYRGKQVSQSKIPGTGLGLSVVKEIVEIHAGRIAVISEVGKGTTFSVWLPVQNGA
jgi:signal transduction histidine kinase